MRNILFRTGLILCFVVFVTLPTFAQMKIGDSPTSITTGAQLDIEKSGSRTVFMDTGKVGIGDVSPASLLTVGSGDLFQVDSSGNIVKINNVTTSFPSSQGSAGTILTNNGSGTLTWSAPAGTSADSLNFTDFSDSLLLDASTDIFSSGTNVLSVTNSGTGLSLRVNDDGTLTDTTPFAIDASGNVGIGVAAPASKLDVAGSIRFSTSGSEKLIANNGGTAFLEYDSVGDVYLRAYDGGGTVRDIHLQTGNPATSRLFVNETGLVGIGTTGPTGNLSVSQTAAATGALKGIVYTGAVNTNQTLSTEIPSLTLTTAGRQWATGALTTQREVLITQPTYSFVGASTITDAATVGIAGAPIKSTNASITNTHGLLVQAGAVSTATNSYGITVNAQTGATNNYSAAFLGGNVGIGTAAPTSTLQVQGTTQIFATNNYNGIFATPGTGTYSNLAIYAGGNNTGYYPAIYMGSHRNYGPFGDQWAGYTLGDIEFQGYGNSAFRTGAKIVSTAETNFSASNYHAKLAFFTTASGSTTPVENLTILGSGNVGIGTTGPTGNLSVSQTIAATGALKGIVYTGAVNTNQTLSTEIPSLTLTTAGRQWATGALTTQREVLITQPTYSFVGASTITDAATVGIAGAPIKSTNASITNTHGLLVQAGAVSTATNSYGITVNAQTGATNNYAAAFMGGNVGIGTAAPTAKLMVSGGNILMDNGSKVYMPSTTNGAGYFFDGSSAWGLRAYNSGSNYYTDVLFDSTGGSGSNSRGIRLMDFNGSAVRLLVGDTGNVGVGNTNPGYLLHVGSSSVTDGTTVLRLEDANSTCSFTANTGAPTCGSDETLKKNITDLGGSLSKIDALRLVEYNWKTDAPGTAKQTGFVAQEVEKIFPKLVSEQKWIDGTSKKFLETAGLVPYLVGATQELSVQTNTNTSDIQSLKKENADMRAEISDLKTRLESLEQKLK